MRNITIVCLFLAITVGSFSQALISSPTQPEPKAWAEHFRNSTVSLGIATTIDGKYTFDAIGTGVLVVKKTATATYLGVVTAKHIVENLSSEGQYNLRIRFASEETKPLNQDYGYKLPLFDSQGRKLWRSLQDGSDIALIPLNNAFMLQFSAEMPKITDAIGIEFLEETKNIYEGEHVVIFGFPSDVSVLMGENALVRAVVRAGMVAWVNPIGTDQPFMIDANILRGNSGGPVFNIPSSTDKYGTFVAGAPLRLLGIVTDTIVNEYVQGIGGLGRVEPASKILTLFNMTFPRF